MNTRILHMLERHLDRWPNGERMKVHVARRLGQLQPVTFGRNRSGEIEFRAEGLFEGRPCIWRLPLPHQKQQAKALFAELEHHKQAGTETPAAEAWRIYQAEREAAKQLPRQPASTPRARVEFDLFGNEVAA